MSFYAYINPALDGRVAMAFLIGRCYKIQISYQLVIAIYIYLLYVYRIIICYYWGIVKLIYLCLVIVFNYSKAFLNTDHIKDIFIWLICKVLPLGLFDLACYYTFGGWGQYVPYHLKDLTGITQEAVGICEFYSGHCITF